MAKPDWQNQSMKKAGCATPVNRMHEKLGGVRHFADGGEVDAEAADKAEGLRLSKDEKVGLWERLKAGNIDEKGSEAYNRWGAGRAQAERAQMQRETNRAAAAKESQDDADFAEEDRRSSTMRSVSGSDVQQTGTPDMPSSPARATTKPVRPQPKTEAKPLAPLMSQEEATSRYRPRYTPAGRAPKTTIVKSARRALSITDAVPDVTKSVVTGKQIGS